VVCKVVTHIAAMWGGATWEVHMGLMDSIKGAVSGNKKTVNDAVDKGADFVESKTPDSIDPQVEKGADALKDVVNKIDE
jgi:hypothetical protein